MQIIIDTATELSDLDRKVIGALLGSENAVSAPATEVKAAAKAPAAKAAQKAAKPAPEPEPEEQDEDLVGGDEPDEAEKVYTMKDATELATKLVQGGKAKEVKAVLTDLGAKRVSELAESDIPAFMSALA